MKVLVTGGYGLVGCSLQKAVFVTNHNCEFKFLSKQDCDLRCEKEVLDVFSKYSPDIVVHLASKVGGVYDNMKNNYDFLMDNIKINTNIVNACKQCNVKRLINILSTCIFPDSGVTYPLSSNQLHGGLPHYSNIGYAYSKRVLHVAAKLLCSSSNIQVVNLIPTNLYGENDNYNMESAHVIPALIHKVYLSKLFSTKLTVKGDGRALRQYCYVDDLSRIILKCVTMELSNKETNIIVSPSEAHQISITELVKMICNEYDYTGEVEYDGTCEKGQHQKTTNDKELLSFLPDFKFTPLSVGLQKTIAFVDKNYSIIRK